MIVMNEANQLIPNASASSPGLNCAVINNDFGRPFCAAGTAEAKYAVEVAAPGFVTKQVQVVVGPVPAPDACGCAGCQTWNPEVVTLVQAP